MATFGRIGPHDLEQTDLKVNAYCLEDEFESLTLAQKETVLDILQTLPETPSEDIWNEFRKKMNILSREQSGGILNPHSKTCWFNSLVQTVFKKRYNFIGILQENSPFLTPQVQKMRADLLQIINMSDEELTGNVKEDFEFNSKFNDQLETFLRAFCTKHEVEYLEQQDSFEMLRYLLSDLGSHTIGFQNFNSFSSQIGFHVATRLYSSTSNVVKDPVIDPQNYLPLSLNGASIQHNLSEFTMNIENLEEDNWVYFGSQKEPTLKVSYLIEQKEPPPTLIISLVRFRTEINSEGNIEIKKDTREVNNNKILAVPFYNKLGTKIVRVAQYALSSVICHEGDTANQGHYTAINVDQPSRITSYNDSIVRSYELQDPDYGAVEIFAAKNGYLTIYDYWGSRAPEEGEFPTLEQALNAS